MYLRTIVFQSLSKVQIVALEFRHKDFSVIEKARFVTLEFRQICLMCAEDGTIERVQKVI